MFSFNLALKYIQLREKEALKTILLINISLNHLNARPIKRTPVT